MYRKNIFFAVFLFAVLGIQADVFKTGETVLNDTFAKPENWSRAKGAEFQKASSFNILKIDASSGGNSNPVDALAVQQDAFGNTAKTKKKHISVSRDVSAELKRFAGYEVEFRAEIKADGVPVPSVPWEGIRLVLNYQTPTANYGSSANGLSGTFEWKTVAFRTRIPVDFTKVSISLGLISDAGHLNIRNLELKTTDVSRSMRYGTVKGIPHKGHSLSRLRGFNRCFEPKNREMTDFWKVNVLKYWMVLPDLSLPKNEIEAYVKEKLKECDKSLPEIERAGAYLVFHVSVGKLGRDQKTQSDFIYVRPGDAEKFVWIWELIAQHYKGNKTFWGFELLNESVLRIPSPMPGCPDYETLMERAACAVNRVDPERTIIIQPEEWYGMNAFYRLRPINAKNLVYAVHFYAPFVLTHQNLFQKNGPDIPYPGKVRGVEWNKEMLRKSMEPAVEFQKAYNVHMFVSEFSCIRWAPGAERWLDDAISLFEELGWDWMYHDIYAWPGWNPELGSDRDSHVRDLNNPRALVLRKWMGKNQFRNKANIEN